MDEKKVFVLFYQSRGHLSYFNSSSSSFPISLTEGDPFHLTHMNTRNAAPVRDLLFPWGVVPLASYHVIPFPFPFPFPFE